MSAEAPARLVWSVAGLLHAIGDALSARFGACVVQGEIAGFSRAGSGHCYFALKDAENHEAQVRCVMFRRAGSLLDFAPGDGMVVEVRGRLTVYDARGDVQFVVEAMRRAGDGTLMERFLRLKEKLRAEGLFDAARKRALPSFPRRMGVVTSPDGAALHDVAAALERRAPQVQLVIYPSLVQGAAAVESLLRAIAVANQRAEVDVLLVCRGGGSVEDLWSFNDERVVRAVADSRLPVIAGIGHETDITLTDFAADVRAPTPTAAAELAAPARAELWQALTTLARRLGRCASQRVDSQAQRIDHLASRLARPGEAIQQQRRNLDGLERRLSSGLRVALQTARTSMSALERRLQEAPARTFRARRAALEAAGLRLELLDPLQVVARGYALLQTPPGDLVRSPAQLVDADELRLFLAEGTATIRITDVRRQG